MKLYIDGKLIGSGVVNAVSDMRYSQQREAHFLDQSGEKVLAELRYPELISINRDGIKLKGFEVKVLDKLGKEKLAYQEWNLIFESNIKLA
jgi:uncharacterized protein YjhX (UPF0386 family)